MTLRRRDILVAGGAVGLVYGLGALPWDRIAGRPAYTEIADLPPFRRLSADGQISGAAAALIGIAPPDADAALRRARAEAMRVDPCPALFGAKGPDGAVPIAYFSEFRCPYCRTLEGDLERLMAADPGAFRLVQHELPIFGPASELAARASVAAARQGKQPELRRRLMRSRLVAEEASVLAVAAGLGLDTGRLARDMASPGVQAELDQSRALADVFGFTGTPGLVIGRTVLYGALPYARLSRIAGDERSLPALVC